MMPLHIEQFRRLKNPQIALAKNALRVLSKGSGKYCATVKLERGIVSLRDTAKSSTKYDYSWLPSQLSPGDQFDLNAICTSSGQRKAAASFLRRMGLRHIGLGIWRYE
jgi:hypothetical protein